MQKVNQRRLTLMFQNPIFEEEKESQVIQTADSHPFSFPYRQELPFFKDPKMKISIWTVLKDSIGKDLSKITVPVYFNQPFSLLQQMGCPTEHLFILDKAAKEKDPIKRLAYIGVYLAVQHTHIEKFP